MSQYKTVLADTLIGENCWLGGFLASDDYFTSRSLVSEAGEITDEELSEEIYQTYNIVLNGKKGIIVANRAVIRGIINAIKGTFNSCTIKNTCKIEPTEGDGWFLTGGSDPTTDAPGTPSWWLGYKGSRTGQFTMENEYQEDGYRPAYVGMSIKTPRITSTGSDGSALIQAYSNISHLLATFQHVYGMTVNICPSEGTGIEFVQNSTAQTPIAFKGNGHGSLNGVIQGYKLNIISSGVINISNGNTVYCSGVNTTIILPKLSNCKEILGTTGAFALDLCIIGASGASGFKVYGSDDSSLTDCKLVHNDHQAWSTTMSQGDVLSLKLIYTGSMFYAYIVSHFQ